MVFFIKYMLNLINLNIYDRNLLLIVTEIFKVKIGLLPQLISDVFEFIEKPYSLRKNLHFKSKRTGTTQKHLLT